MHSEKRICRTSILTSRSWVAGLALASLVGALGCSSGVPEKEGLYGSAETGRAETQDPNTVAVPHKPGSPSPSAGQPVVSDSRQPAVSQPSYSKEDQAVILRYAEWGPRDKANLEKVLKWVERAEKLPSAQRTMEDYLMLSAHYWFNGDKKKVVQYANQGIMAKSDNSRVKAYMFIYLGYTYEEKSPTMALSYFRQASRIAPEFYRGHYEWGRMAYAKRDFPQAGASLKKVLDSGPDNAEVYGMLGQMFYGMDRYEEAAESLEAALNQGANAPWIYLKLANTYFYGLKLRKKAEPYYKEAVAKGNSDPAAHYGMALYYRFRSKYDLAEEELEKAHALDHTNPKYKREIKDMGEEKKEVQAGQAKLLEVIKKKPDEPDPVIRLGRFYLRWQKFDLAEAQFKLAVKMKPKDVQYANILGWFYFNDRKWQKAEEAFSAGLQTDPKNTEALFGLGQAYEEQKQYKKAASQYTQILSLDPKHEEAQTRLTRLKDSGKLVPVVEVENKPAAAGSQKNLAETVKSPVAGTP